MADYIEYETDWGYYITPENFQMASVRGKVPVGAVVLTKGRETLDTGMTVVVTEYRVARQNGLEELGGKREASRILAKQMLEFMKSKKEYPPDTDIKKEYANGNVDLEFVTSEYDKFTIKLTAKLVGGEVFDFLAGIARPGRRGFDPVEDWKIERAKSSRAKCRTCGVKIEKDTLRFGEPSFFQDHKSWKWHHFSCMSDEVRGIPKEKLEGYSDLDDEAKSEVSKALWD
jgi:hypothetical protein